MEGGFAEALDMELFDNHMEEDTHTQPTLPRAVSEGGEVCRREIQTIKRSAPTTEYSPGGGPQRSIEGWIILVTGVHTEAQEDDLHNVFSDFGVVKNLHLNLDRRTGYVKGYALIEYEDFQAAEDAISTMNGAELLTQTIFVGWAFGKGPIRERNTGRPPHSRRYRSPRRIY